MILTASNNLNWPDAVVLIVSLVVVGFVMKWFLRG